MSFLPEVFCGAIVSRLARTVGRKQLDGQGARPQRSIPDIGLIDADPASICDSRYHVS
jgi:hypothetical protein